MDEKARETADHTQHLLEENRRIAQRLLEVEQTSRKQLEKLRSANAVLARGETHMRILLENADIGFALLDRSLRVVTVNHTLCMLLGYTSLELTGISFANLVYVGSVAPFSRLAGFNAPRNQVSESIELMAKDGRLVPCRMAVSDWMDDQGASKGIFILVSSREEETRAISRLHALEETVIETDRSRKLFLDVISRELRFPASGIMGMIRMLMDDALTERQRELADAIHTSAATIARVVDDMVEMVQLENTGTAVRTAPYRPAGVAHGAAAMFAVRAEEKDLQIHVTLGSQVPERLLGDAGRIRRVLAHLLDNAVKFTERGRITLSVDVIGDSVRYMVSDTGIGIRTDPAVNLFDTDALRDTPAARRFGGMGIGLPICKKLVHFMGGKIGYESEEGRGSEFHFTLPIVCPDADEPDAVELPAEAIRLAPMRILLADGNVLNRQVVRAYLQFDGHNLTVVDNGLEAAELCGHEQFDVAILDRTLPKLDGFQTIRLIRDDEKQTGRSRLPVILMGVQNKDAETGRRAGADTVVNKPITPVALMRAVSEATGSEPIAIAGPRAPAPYAPASGGSLRRIDGGQLFNLRQVMERDQFHGLLRFFVEDAIPIICTIIRHGSDRPPDWERMAFSAAKIGGLAAFLGFSQLSEVLKQVEHYGREEQDASGLESLMHELSAVMEDSLEELKRVYPDIFATLSFSGPKGNGTTETLEG